MATKTQNIQYQLNEWCKEYGIDHTKVTFAGWKDLNDSDSPLLGTCSYRPEGCVIKLGVRFENKPLGWLEMSVLWHEYCHAEAYLEDMIPDGHNGTWKSKKNRKIAYVIGDAVAKFLYPIL